MAIGKPRGRNGMRQVFVYNPAAGRKVYVGSRQKLRGPGSAQELERDKAREFANQIVPVVGAVSMTGYATDWLEHDHGPGTRRPSLTTKQVNESNLKPFLAAYGDRPVDVGVSRQEALRFAKKHPRSAKVVSAMLNDAVDQQAATANPFANRRQQQPRERKDIVPVTEDEINTLVRIANDIWKGYGPVVGAWITFGAWVGCRPGETFSVTALDLDPKAGEVTIRRVKKRGNVYPTDVVVLPQAAVDAINQMPAIPARGPIFTTTTGKAITKGSQRYYWDAVRKVFEQQLDPVRRNVLLAGRDLDFYELRHFCGSMMADRGLSEHDIAHQLGNSVQVCRETYIHAYRDRTNDRVRQVLNAGGGSVSPIREVS